ncbi:MAG: DUF5723 family protein [Marinilabiliales bacterium]|nr:DUF5723 family protein [Marinilabiliales bacterium]
MGLGIDAGFYMKLKEKWGASVSVTDFGFINWVKNAKSYTIDNASFKFEGLKIDSFNLEGIDRSLL